MKKIFSIVLSMISMVAFSQHEHDHSDHSHDLEEVEKHDGHHDHHTHEIGMANAPVYFIKEKEWTYGLHLHYIYNIEHSRYGIGLGYEKIFDEHEHQTVGVVLSYRAADAFVINFAPGVTFEKEEETEVNFAAHLEATYEWEFGNIHLGPVFELAYDPEDLHIALGLHVGYGF